MLLSIIPHQLTFKRPARTSRGEYRTRKLWYVEISSPESPFAKGLGECAPLPDLSCDALHCTEEEYEAVLRRAAEHVERTGEIDYEALRDYPSILFGLETALLSFEASKQGEATQLYDTPFARGECGIAINGLIWMGNADYMAEQMEDKVQKGFRCIKLKIGALDFEKEYALLKSLRERFSHEQITLRIDANGAYSPERALQILEALAPLHIHSIEQPIRAGQWQAMRKLCEASPIPIALDEELIGINRPEQKAALLDAIHPQYLVLKPSLHGGIRGTLEWIRLAEERGISYWLTSALESNVGLNAIAQLASTIRLPGMLHTQGLGTGALFESNYPGTLLTIEGDELWVKPGEERAFEQQVAGFMAEFQSPAPTLRVQTSGSTGTPKTIEVEKSRMQASARATCDFLGFYHNPSPIVSFAPAFYPLPIVHYPLNKALLCLPIEYIAGKMMVVRSLERGMKLIVRKPSGHPLRHINTPLHFAAFTPLQVYNMLRDPDERKILETIQHVIIGGGSIPSDMAEALRPFKNAIWSTYGMTETLSHIALRRLSGPEASAHYSPLPGASVSLDAEHRIVIDAPGITDAPLTTNDIGELFPDGSFRILGRTDCTICTGGIKVQPEPIEQCLAEEGIEGIVTSVPDPKFGQAIVLLHTSPKSAEELKILCAKLFKPHQVPRHFLAVERLPLTANGKISRSEAKAMAAITLC